MESNQSVSIIPLGGVGNVTSNMYLYEYNDEILIVDCGLGFPDPSLSGVDLLIPDITYLKETKKKIVGLVLTHGHEDHIGALPFILPDLGKFPMYGTPFTTTLVNEKLSQFRIASKVNMVNFQQTIKVGSFSVSFARVTHSVLDASNLFIKTPVGNFYHGSDFKFDFTPEDARPSELGKISRFGEEGVLCLLEDSLGSEREGYTHTEKSIEESFENEFRKAQGKIFMTTYSSNISRLNQAIRVAVSMKKRICFLGRSLLKGRDVARTLGYMSYPAKSEIKPHEVNSYKPSEVLILVAGSQAQEDSALVRIATGNDKDLRIEKGDTVIFSSDPIPGNEISVNSIVDLMSKIGARVRYTANTHEFHVSGHGSQQDIKLLISLTRPQFLFPIGGTYKQMVAYRDIARSMGYDEKSVVLIENGQEVVFTRDSYRLGKKLPLKTIFVDQITGEEVEEYVIVDKQKISKEGVAIVIIEIDAQSGVIVDSPDILTKGFVYEDKKAFSQKLKNALDKRLGSKGTKVGDWSYYKKILGKTAEELFFREKREPLVVPIILEV